MNKPRYTVMSILDLDPKKFGTFEEYLVFLTKELTHGNARHIIIFAKKPTDHVQKEFDKTAAVIECVNFHERKYFSLLKLLKLIRYYQPDIIHTHFLKFICLPMSIIFFCYSHSILFSEHISNTFIPPKNIFETYILKLKRIVKRIWAIRIKLIITPSNYMRNLLINRDCLSHRKVITIHNGTNTDYFKSCDSDNYPKSFGITENSTVISTIAQAIPIKGIDYFIKAAGIVLNEIRTAKFLYVGDGPFINIYKKLAADMGLKDNFIFTGFLQKEKVKQMLQLSDIFVIPSTKGEAFALVVLEAMAAAKPVIGTKSGGTPEAICEEETGLLVNPEDVQALASAIIRLCINKELAAYMGKAGRIRAERFFSLQVMAKKTVARYEAILK